MTTANIHSLSRPRAELPVLLVSATRLSERDFWTRSLLGLSLSRLGAQKPPLLLHSQNTGERLQGLPSLYNQSVREHCKRPHIVLFVHDDVYLHDPFTAHRLGEGLKHYDIIGLAGSQTPYLSEPSWALKFDADLRPIGWQSGGVKFSGAVSHTTQRNPPSDYVPQYSFSTYGDMPAEVDFLDGLFIATTSDVALEHPFDERFQFNGYDLDFCRSAKNAGLSLGTWPIAVTHGSVGNYDSESFRKEALVYLDKWKPTVRQEFPEAVNA